jgi:hypothetical protein
MNAFRFEWGRNDHRFVRLARTFRLIPVSESAQNFPWNPEMTRSSRQAEPWNAGLIGPSFDSIVSRNGKA